MATSTAGDLDAFLEAMAPRHDPVQRAMADRATTDDFPIVGRIVGGVLHQLTLATRARRVFEFGSGFGYSAYWIARALPEDGRVILTEEDHDELSAAESYFERGGLADRARFEPGDALAAVERVEGPFELVHIDSDKERYRDAFEAIRPAVPAGGAVVADNAITAGPMDTEGLVRAIAAGDSADGLDDMTAGVHAYLEAVRDDPAFATTVLPVGSGIAVSVRRPD